MPADLSIDRRKRIFIGIIGGLQGDDRVEEQPQSFGCFNARVHVPLLFPVVSLGEQPCAKHLSAS